MLKRTLDIVIASSALVVLSPLYLYVAYKVRKNLGSPVLFRQTRPGLHGQPFEMIKFRTMTDARDASGQLLSNDQRLTPFGKMLRATSLDEIPELWNVLKGEMSIVGPRPLLMDYLPLYNAEQAKRHDVRPGMTGLAQVNGRNSISWQEKFKLDTWYVEHQSVWLDFKIMLQTVKKVLVKEGINQSEAVTMTRFTGNPPDDHASK
ncbi:lipopolysaccharide/colanic/teichoic acid biosynthesis glycosyltransferase [Acinetobacter baylyi]|uniref:Lipopolysaccharide/colanic/teichoic acid biosynthesis glycosyltransferase n=1 Tax=Acinetobacter baylyi TaxID=202950 RepID=A0ABU0UXJ4_ACIBI|nr:sugar transferase [Acinetobacter baylyi]MDQ1209283.1 lipopolysaccharide/colanic/teichoic acid biosynthesis glycosyltransferase [Acinetobacter baylyi]MDR6107125.1 lipopolysaccharide/colanic/teichoic acid biosynthesis glycosyltransferase [Acinetobacter baylyi]MDR6186154.1 lipopolysaccharide/colanic/teichoic acid biosynthesis glycosyltransferase [Acinetobacter baylyi]